MKLQKKATIIATIAAFLLMIIKMIVGVFSGSIAVISSAVDSLLDMGMSIFNLFAVHTAEKNPDHVYNYGRGKIEAIAAFLEGVLITVSGIFIFSESVQKIIFNDSVKEVGVAIWVMIFSVVVTGILVAFLSYVQKKTKSIVVEADVLHYKTDLFSNSAILLGLLVLHFTQFHYIDAILGILIAMYILWGAVEIIKKGYTLLLDVSLDVSEVREIKKIILDTPKISGLHAFKTRQSADVKFVEAHLVFNREISLLDAHNISHQIEDKIREISSSKYSIMFHLEPYDDRDFEKNFV